MGSAAAVPSYRVFSAPLRYVQGPGVLDRIGELLRARHARAAVLVDALLLDALCERLEATFAAAGIDATLIPVSGEVTLAHIDALAAIVGADEPTVVVAVGGGKTLDTGKGVSSLLGCRMVTVPTIASNDGPTSRIIALYSDSHELIDTPRMDENPEAVIVDTQLICEAPPRFLVAGIGDAVAKWFEAAACARGTGVTPNGTRPLGLPLAVAEACYRALLDDAAAAVAATEARTVSPPLERVVEAVVLMSGLAFENGGLSLAHALTRGLMALPRVQTQLHGFHVAYGLLVQLAHEGNEPGYVELSSFFQRIGLPLTLHDLGAAATPSAVKTIVTATLDAPHMPNCVPVPTRSSLEAAVHWVEGDDEVEDSVTPRRRAP
jgi:glycerol dehydrogenase